ncbi:MAG: helix-turn-helix domain-containing protein [Candidatus Bathyarchaeota archaeon]
MRKNIFDVSLKEEGELSDAAIIESELKGKTLIVYWYLLKHAKSTIGVREVQRKLGFSSPSVAAYHLDKLYSLGLVGKTATGEYYLTQEVKVGVLKLFTRFGGFLIPRYLFYSIWFSAMFITYLLLYGHTGSIHNIAAIIFGLIGNIILWFETFKLWRGKPF